MKYKCKIILFFFFCALIVPLDLHAQGSIVIRTEANVLDSIIIDIESGIDILFTEDAENYVVGSVDTETSSPAIVRVSGAAVEAMIDVEFQQTNGIGAQGGEFITISEFNLSGKESGSSVNIMPSSDDETFLLRIGGTVKNVEKTDEFYTGVNVLNINYL